MTTTTKTPKAKSAKAKSAPREHHVTYAITVTLPPQIGGRAPTQKALLAQAQSALATAFPGSTGTAKVSIRDRRTELKRQADERRHAKARKARRAAATPERNTAPLASR